MARILIIDDEEGVRVTLKQYLELDHHSVSVAEDGEQGVAAYRTGGHDLVITDIMMPGTDGVDVILQMRQINPSVPLLAISGGRRGIDKNFSLESAHVIGADRILPKPFNRHELQQAISACLEV